MGGISVLSPSFSSVFRLGLGEAASNGMELLEGSSIGKTSGTFELAVDALLLDRVSASSFVRNPPTGYAK